MMKLFRQNKIFTICLLITVLAFVSGILFGAVLDNDTKQVISSNIDKMIAGIDQNKLNFQTIIANVFNNFSFISLVWIFGISVVGIVIVVFLYSLKVFMFAFEFMALLSNLSLGKLLFIIGYLCTDFLNLIVFFVLLYYSVNYSIVLTKILFFKRSYNIAMITKRYLKVLLFCLLCGLVTALFESLIVSKFLKLLI